MPERTSAQQQHMLAQQAVIRITGFMDVTLTEVANPRKLQVEDVPSARTALWTDLLSGSRASAPRPH